MMRLTCSRIIKYRKKTYINFNKKNMSYDYKNKEDNNLLISNFINSCMNVIIITSLLWGFESYNEKLKIINETRSKVDEIWYHCIKEKKELKRVLTRQLNDANNRDKN